MHIGVHPGIVCAKQFRGRGQRNIPDVAPPLTQLLADEARIR